ncbi:hypothetical protein [Glaciibacter flavus]|uniref:hypothetical protein n=1 Tax=Orlajensenia flava TaxID=2565934 RepID=UPI003B0029A0
MSDEYDSDDASARELWRFWRERYPTDEQAEARWGAGAVHITWYINGEVFEGAPHTINVNDYEPETFLDHFTLPIDDETGEPIERTRLPVDDKLWRDGRNDKGGFIQDATGWKPSPLQPVFWPDQLAEACGLFIPAR